MLRHPFSISKGAIDMRASEVDREPKPTAELHQPGLCGIAPACDCAQPKLFRQHGRALDERAEQRGRRPGLPFRTATRCDKESIATVGIVLGDLGH
jgi:hypothetical protein